MNLYICTENTPPLSNRTQLEPKQAGLSSGQQVFQQIQLRTLWDKMQDSLVTYGSSVGAKFCSESKPKLNSKYCRIQRIHAGHLRPFTDIVDFLTNL